MVVTVRDVIGSDHRLATKVSHANARNIDPSPHAPDAGTGPSTHDMIAMKAHSSLTATSTAYAARSRRAHACVDRNTPTRIHRAPHASVGRNSDRHAYADPTRVSMEGSSRETRAGSA